MTVTIDVPADIVSKQNPSVSMEQEKQDFPDTPVNIAAVLSRLTTATMLINSEQKKKLSIWR